MYKKIILILVLGAFFLSYRFVFAGLIINEIMYDLSGSDSTNSKSREWIEIYNPDGEISIDASKWRIYDGGANRTINNEIDFSISSKAYVIFAGDKDTFLMDHPGFGGVVYDTGFTSLNNTGATLKILDQDGSVVDSFSYTSSQGGAGDGNSLQKISGSWFGATPNPGGNNSIAATLSNPVGDGALVSNVSSTNNLSSQFTTNTTTKDKTAEEIRITTKIITKTLGFSGSPLSFEGQAYGYQGEKLFYGKYFWNFGDGDSKETEANNNQKFTHTYYYPGEYIVSLDYFKNYYSDTSDASDWLLVSIVDADVFISRVGDEKDFFIELKNNTDYNIDISNWFLASDQRSFVFPKNTVIGNKKSLIISPKISGFYFSDKNSLKLKNTEKETVFEYSSNVLSKTNQKTTTSLNISEKTRNSQDSGSNEYQKNLEASIVSGAQSSFLDTNEKNFSLSNENEKSGDSKIIIFTAFLALVGVSAFLAYFIRQKRTISKPGDDFQILDE